MDRTSPSPPFFCTDLERWLVIQTPAGKVHSVLYTPPALPAKETLTQRADCRKRPGSKKKHPRGSRSCPASLETGNVSPSSRSQVWGWPRAQPGVRGRSGERTGWGRRIGGRESLTAHSRERPQANMRIEATEPIPEAGHPGEPKSARKGAKSLSGNAWK